MPAFVNGIGFGRSASAFAPVTGAAPEAAATGTFAVAFAFALGLGEAAREAPERLELLA